MSVTTRAHAVSGIDGVREGAEAPHVLDKATRQTLHDGMLVELEDHSPEGEETRGLTRGVWRLAVGTAAAAVVGALVLLGVMAGWPAVALGLMIVLMVYLIGAGPEWAAARLRRREQKGFERVIESKIKRVERRAAKHADRA